MASIKIKKLITDDADLMRVQQNYIESLNDLFTSVTILDGIILKDIVLVSASTNKVAHKLGRAVRGFLVVKKSGVADIYNSTVQSLSDSFLSLETSVNVTVSLWVF